jgi:hypothetical protein
METTAVSPAEIDAFLAEVCKDAIATWWDNDTYRWNYEASFTTSLDALFAPGGPVEKCREQGWRVLIESGADTYGCVLHNEDNRAVSGLGAPSLALAEACYKALK